jgi:hypothetical protein
LAGNVIDAREFRPFAGYSDFWMVPRNRRYQFDQRMCGNALQLIQQAGYAAMRQRLQKV